MLYAITSEHKNIIIESDNPDLERLYKDFMLDLAKSLGFVINIHWLNLANHGDHHPHMSLDEYAKAANLWYEKLQEWSFENYAIVKHGAELKNCKRINL